MLTQQDFSALHQNAKIVSQHGLYGPKVFILENGDYVKVFNPKPGLTKRRFFPKYKKFISNAEKLNALSVPAVTVKNIYFLEQNKNYAVRYQPLPGQDLRSLAEDPDEIRDFLPFLAKLHELGIYFRGVHLGNVLKISENKYGLIDATDLYFKWGSLSSWHRVRNIAHMLNTSPDDKLFAAYGKKQFIKDYIKVAKLSGLQKISFLFFAKCYGVGV